MLLFILLNIIDLTLTLIGLKLGLFEGNLLYNFLFSNDLIIGILVKITLTFLIAWLIKKYKTKLFKPLNIAFICIVVWNLGGIILWLI